jgi:hypothetical protein
MDNINLVSATNYLKEVYNNVKDQLNGAWNGMPLARENNSICRRGEWQACEYLSGVQSSKYPSGMFFVSPKNDHLEMAKEYAESENKNHFVVYCEVNNPAKLKKVYYVYMLLSDYLTLHDPLKPYIQDILRID